MLDFDTDIADRIARLHAEWSETGDEEARNQLFELLDSWVRKQAHFMLVRRFGSARPVNTGTFAQDVLTKLLTRLHSVEYRGLRQLLAYILAALRTYLIDVAHASQARPVRLPTETGRSHPIAVSSVELATEPGSTNVTIVGGDVSSLVILLTILGRIEQIHPLHGLILQLRVLGEFSLAEIADHLGLPHEEVDRILRNARTKLRHEWNKATRSEATSPH